MTTLRHYRKSSTSITSLSLRSAWPKTGWNGGVYTLANLRGSGEYGEAWHQDGIRRKKQNGIDDFIAAAEWLIENNYTSSSKMIANGGSASGILPGAALLQRPDLFGAAVINYPTLDQLRYVEFGSARSWIPEFGTPEDPDDFEALYAYSPYHNLKEGICYPPTSPVATPARSESLRSRERLIRGNRMCVFSVWTRSI